MTHTQIILSYDYLYENRIKLFTAISAIVPGAYFARCNSYIVNPVLTEVCHCTLKESTGYVALIQGLPLIDWDYPDSVSMFVRFESEVKFEEVKIC